MKTVGVINNYVSLEEKNRQLLTENAQLRSKLHSLEFARNASFDSSLMNAFVFVPANVVGSTYTLNQNYITIDKGELYGIKPGMGVASPSGVVGKIKSVSRHFSVATSVLHTQYQLSTQLKKGGHRCVVSWSGKDYAKANLLYVGRHVKLQIGDTVITSSESAVFPAGITVGTVDAVKKDPSKIFYDVDIKLAVDFTSLDNVYVIKSKFIREVDSLQKLSK